MVTATRQYISSGSDFEKLAGYSRAVVVGDDIHVSGTTGFDYARMRIADDLTDQIHQTFANLAAALDQCGSSLDDVVRVRYFLTQADDFEVLAPIAGKYFSHARPAATALVVGLVDRRMKVEIEVTAKKGL